MRLTDHGLTDHGLTDHGLTDHGLAVTLPTDCWDVRVPNEWGGPGEQMNTSGGTGAEMALRGVSRVQARLLAGVRGTRYRKMAPGRGGS